jgi:hypothetical protein
MTSAAHQVRSVLDDLEAAGANLRCNDLIGKLRLLGFEVRDGKKQGHKVFTHPGMPTFTSRPFTCGHGRNPEIRPVYVRKVLKVLRDYETELTHYLRERP